MLRNRALLIGLLVLFTLAQVGLSSELMRGGFDWRPLWGAPIVKATLLDFTFTVLWCALYLLDTARAQRRNGWAWLPLLLILPTVALLLFTLTTPRESAE
ncbi:MAG TPA: hypothetical protein VFU47_17640 [Armatimonadota bacterium]|nr:hypothetical protein [Armatimonadota bacterium]